MEIIETKNYLKMQKFKKTHYISALVINQMDFTAAQIGLLERFIAADSAQTVDDGLANIGVRVDVLGGSVDINLLERSGILRVEEKLDLGMYAPSSMVYLTDTGVTEALKLKSQPK